MSTNQLKKQGSASKIIITSVVVLIFISSGFFYYHFKNNIEHTEGLKKSKPEASIIKITEAPSLKLQNDSPPLPVAKSKHKATEKTDERAVSLPILSPIPALDVALKSITVNADTGHTIISSNHSQLVIPPFAFLDKYGKIVSGEVDVRYREFHNYLDIFLSGIPMNYDSAGAWQLESAGMIELGAFKGGETLYVNRASKIKVLLSSMNKSTNYNLYYFDTAQKKWIYKGKDEMITDADATPAKDIPGRRMDTVQKLFQYQMPEHKIKVAGYLEPVFDKRNFLFSKKAVPRQVTFHLNAIQNDVPELDTIRRIKWKYTGTDASTVYYDLFCFRVWRNMSLFHVKEDDTYLLTLSDQNQSVSLKIVPLILSEIGWAGFYTKFPQFAAAQDVRLANEKKRFEKFQADTATYFATNSRFEQVSMTTESRVIRQFQVDGFGIWNCDRPIQMPQATVLAAAFTDNNNNPLKPDRVYLTEKTSNTVYTYPGSQLYRFKFNPDAQNLIWALFPGDRIAVIKPDEFRKKYSKAKGNVTFKIEIENSQLTREELKKRLTFDL